MTKIFGERRAPWQKYRELFSIKQGENQSALDYAGALRQEQSKTEIGNDILLAVFIDGLHPSISKTLAIMNPESSSDAVDQASRLESLEKPRSAGAESLVAMEI